MGGLHSTCDIYAFHSMVTIRYEELTLVCSRFCYNVYWWLCSVCFACEVDSKIFLLLSFFIFYKYI